MIYLSIGQAACKRIKLWLPISSRFIRTSALEIGGRERRTLTTEKAMKQQNDLNSEQPLNRRRFLKTTSTAVVGGTLLGNLSIERSAFAAADYTLNIALIGCG